MSSDLIGLLRRGLRKPPRVVLRRLWDTLHTEAERFLAGPRARRFSVQKLLRATASQSLEALWQRLGSRPYPALETLADPACIEQSCPGERERILTAADAAVDHVVQLLGSGPMRLGESIDWHKDYKSGWRWPPGYALRMDYCNPERPSDVKVPWEISRVQWLLPAGQAYVLTGDERYAAAVQGTLDHWIAENPYAQSVNWACTMEVALRILTWTWLFRVLHRSRSWSDVGFRSRFLRALFLHGDFTERHLERSDINGNHFTADAAGLVFAGLFFGEGTRPRRWQELGWNILCQELFLQVSADGVDFEASVAYHRLVLELFLLPAMYRQSCALTLPEAYRERLLAMARFVAAYSRPDSTVPLVGDADDGRALPLGRQDILDHRYLIGMAGLALHSSELQGRFSGPRGELFWTFGPEGVTPLPPPFRRGDREGLPEAPQIKAPASQEFAQGGFYIMRNAVDHVFIDCGPVGMGGRGGHGHNDCLSFEAVLDGVLLVSDCGAFVYTASYEERNRFRSTAYHNTPQVDGAEINRFVRPDYLWSLHYDARPTVHLWRPGADMDLLRCSHAGYQRLAQPVTPWRTVGLEHERHLLLIRDQFQGRGNHTLEVPLHLALAVEVAEQGPGELLLKARGQEFTLRWGDPRQWTLHIGPGRVSPSYGIALPVTRLAWQRTGDLAAPLLMALAPSRLMPASLTELEVRLSADER